jgi:hypothetical protein
MCIEKISSKIWIEEISSRICIEKISSKICIENIYRSILFPPNDLFVSHSRCCYSRVHCLWWISFTFSCWRGSKYIAESFVFSSIHPFIGRIFNWVQALPLCYLWCRFRQFPPSWPSILHAKMPWFGSSRRETSQVFPPAHLRSARMD